MPKPSMCWFDLESTGLAASLDVPLELGIVLTDDWGGEIASASWLIHEPNLTYERGMKRGRENEYVNAMHDKSGLWKDLINRPVWTRSATQDMAQKFLRSFGVERGDLPMCGNSIGSLDRPFSIVHLPALNEFLSYRNIDMSTLKEICKRVNPELFENIKPWVENKEAATHRVLDDCRASIKEYQIYLDEFLITEEY